MDEYDGCRSGSGSGDENWSGESASACFPDRLQGYGMRHMIYPMGQCRHADSAASPVVPIPQLISYPPLTFHMRRCASLQLQSAKWGTKYSRDIRYAGCQPRHLALSSRELASCDLTLICRSASSLPDRRPVLLQDQAQQAALPAVPKTISFHKQRSSSSCFVISH